jgi:hypothetical protein
MFLDMRGRQVEGSAFTHAGSTCLPAMGFAFAAGTTDGELSPLPRHPPLPPPPSRHRAAFP